MLAPDSEHTAACLASGLWLSRIGWDKGFWILVVLTALRFDLDGLTHAVYLKSRPS